MYVRVYECLRAFVHVRARGYCDTTFRLLICSFGDESLI